MWSSVQCLMIVLVTSEVKIHQSKRIYVLFMTDLFQLFLFFNQWFKTKRIPTYGVLNCFGSGVCCGWVSVGIPVTSSVVSYGAFKTARQPSASRMWTSPPACRNTNDFHLCWCWTAVPHPPPPPAAFPPLSHCLSWNGPSRALLVNYPTHRWRCD